MYNIRKTCAKVGVILILLACLLVSMAGTAFADMPTATAVIEIKQIFQVQNGYEASAGLNCKYKFKSLDPSNPMPSGLNSDGELEFTLSGISSQSISIEYTHAGLYQYQVQPVIDKVFENYYYDENIYNIDVYVENDGDGLKTTIVISNQAGEKYGEICYYHYYWVHSIPKTGDESDPSVFIWTLAASTAAVSVLAFVLRRKKHAE